MRFTTASNTSIIPMPSLALANMACDESSPITSSIWRKLLQDVRPADLFCLSRDDLQSLLHCQVCIGQGLSLHALCGIYH